LFWKSFGRRDTSSATVFAFLEEFRVERTLLYYRFCFSGRVSGGETPPLLPFLFFRRSFGWRDTCSATVFAFLEEFRVERTLLYYRFCLWGGVSGRETPALLPFLLSWKNFGRRDTSSVNFPVGVFAMCSNPQLEITLHKHYWFFS
ncbi:hypothetical protein, partial [Bacillus sp. RO2]|uniref:hypothetical protein n=1 Tax=Bacillus sp. RO2 TaxID=2723913 RepID=UPI00197BC5E7